MNLKNLKEDDAEMREQQSKEEVKPNILKKRTPTRKRNIQVGWTSARNKTLS